MGVPLLTIEELIHTWENNFSSLSKSRITNTCDVEAAQREITSLSSSSNFAFFY